MTKSGCVLAIGTRRMAFEWRGSSVVRIIEPNRLYCPGPWSPRVKNLVRSQGQQKKSKEESLEREADERSTQGLLFFQVSRDEPKRAGLPFTSSPLYHALQRSRQGPAERRPMNEDWQRLSG